MDTAHCVSPLRTGGRGAPHSRKWSSILMLLWTSSYETSQLSDAVRRHTDAPPRAASLTTPPPSFPLPPSCLHSFSPFPPFLLSLLSLLSPSFTPFTSLHPSFFSSFFLLLFLHRVHTFYHTFYHTSPHLSTVKRTTSGCPSSLNPTTSTSPGSSSPTTPLSRPTGTPLRRWETGT